MLLAVDIGNTHTVLGFFRKARLLSHRRMTSAASWTEDEVWLHVRFFHGDMKGPREPIHGVVISSVVPELTDIYLRMSEKMLGLEPLLITSSLDLGITVLYDDATKVGADRLCNAVAAYTKYGGPAIVVDFGTATTYDVISRKGEYLGGVIAPGLTTGAAELHRRTAQLPRVELHFPEAIIGKNTVASIQTGVMYGAVDAAEGMIRRIKKIVGKGAAVVATGGYAAQIAHMTGEIRYLEPSLVLDGARLIFERTVRRKR